MKSPKLIIITFLLFIIIFVFGLNRAVRKPFWGDEIYSHISSITGNSYSRILLGKISEGNTCPLFFFLQKATCDAIGYKPPLPWLKGQWDYPDKFAQVFLRINPVFFMSLSLVLIFYYFARFYSIYTAFYSLVISLSSFMVWAYWAEARVYSLWFFLTTAQLLIFLCLTEEYKKNDKRLWSWLVIVHFFLSLTIIFAMLQIIIVSFLLWLFLERNWKKYITLTVIPACLSLYYYSKSPKYDFYFLGSSLRVIFASFPRDRLCVVGFFAIFLFCIFFSKRKISFSALLENNQAVKGLPFFLLTSLTLLAASVVVFIFKLGVKSPTIGFEISNRYFINLTPVGIIAVTLFSVILFRAFKKRTIMRLIFLLLLASLVGLRCYRYFF